MTKTECAAPRTPSRILKSQIKGRFFKRWIAGLLILSALIIVVLNRAEIGRLVDLMRQAQFSWLAVGAVLQIGTYTSS